jgi:hypothetical protein
MKVHFIPHSINSISNINTNELMLDGKLIAVFSEIRSKHINALRRSNAEFRFLKLAVYRPICTTSLQNVKGLVTGRHYAFCDVESQFINIAYMNIGMPICNKSSVQIF